MPCSTTVLQAWTVKRILFRSGNGPEFSFRNRYWWDRKTISTVGTIVHKWAKHNIPIKPKCDSMPKAGTGIAE